MCQRQRPQTSAFPLTLHLPLPLPQFPPFIGYWSQVILPGVQDSCPLAAGPSLNLAPNLSSLPSQNSVLSGHNVCTPTAGAEKGSLTWGAAWIEFRAIMNLDRKRMTSSFFLTTVQHFLQG